MVHFAARCVAGDVPFAVLDLMETSAMGDWRLSVPPDSADFVSGAERVRLADLTGLYIRPIYRLAAVKRRYDPGNVFRRTHNIVPGRP